MMAETQIEDLLMIQVERIKNSSRRRPSGRILRNITKYYEISTSSHVLLQRGQELCLSHQEQSHLVKRLKVLVISWNKKWPQTH